MPDVRATHCTRHGPSTYSLRLATMSTSIQTRMSVSVELPADDSGANDSIAPLARNDHGQGFYTSKNVRSSLRLD